MVRTVVARIIEGTKGGRPRDTHVVDKEAALRVIWEAKAVLKAQGGG